MSVQPDPWVRCPPTDRALIEGLHGPVRPVAPDELLRELHRRYAAGGTEVAVIDRDREWTYAQLGRWVAGLRAGLRAAHPPGPGPARPVFAVAIDRSAELVAAVHAVALDGGAYCPLSPDDPPAWREPAIARSGAVATLVSTCDAAGADRSPAEFAVDRWSAASAPAAPAGPAGPAGPEPARVGPDDPAQVIFTSGSTGQPKGVLCTHLGFANRISWMQRTFPLTTVDRVALKTPVTFDVAGWELFWPQYAGAQTVVVPPGEHGSPEALIATFTKHRVTVAHFVPSMLRLWLRADGARRCPDLRLVFCSGEALSADLVEEFGRQSDARLHNLYGPTEAAIDVTHFPLDPGRHDPVPIGRPIANTRIYLLAADQTVCPVGELGEICIQGIGVATGYLDAPAADARRFDPLPGLPAPAHWRTFRTGDLGRCTADGQLEFAGRRDDQVKIRGQRVELGEVEAALRGHELVLDACARAYQSDTGRQCLAAYVTVTPGCDAPDPVGTLADHLLRTLPSRSVPARIVLLDELPLGAHGKVDRGRLPPPGRARPDLRQPFQPPATRLEAVIAGAWAHVLDLDEVGRDDTFTDLGGDSLAAVEIWFLLGDRLGLDHDSDLLAAVIMQGDTVATAARIAVEGGLGAADQ